MSNNWIEWKDRPSIFPFMEGGEVLEVDFGGSVRKLLDCAAFESAYFNPNYCNQYRLYGITEDNTSVKVNDLNGLIEEIEPIVTDKKDKGSHYRYKYKGIKLDPYRICKLYGVPQGPHEYMLKKLLRASGKGHSEEDLIQELQCCLDRWKEMLQEDK